MKSPLRWHGVGAALRRVFSLGVGWGGRQVILRFTNILEQGQEGRSRHWDTRRLLQWRGKLCQETDVWGQSLEESPEHCAINTVNNMQRLNSRRVLGTFKIRSQSEAAGGNLERWGRWDASHSSHRQQMKRVNTSRFTSILVFWKDGPLLAYFGDREGRVCWKNLVSGMHFQRSQVP